MSSPEGIVSELRSSISAAAPKSHDDMTFPCDVACCKGRNRLFRTLGNKAGPARVSTILGIDYKAQLVCELRLLIVPAPVLLPSRNKVRSRHAKTQRQQQQVAFPHGVNVNQSHGRTLECSIA